MGAERREDGAAGTSPAPVDDRSTGLPLLRTWRAVYVFVVLAFLTWVALLTALERVFS
jgi:hypothetical protein